MVVTVAPGRADESARVADALDDGLEASLLTAAGEAVRLPGELRAVLSAAARALSDGQEVVVAGKDSYLTTQEAADFLGVSRPTLIRTLDLGEIPYQRPNSHRRIKLADLVAHQGERAARRAALDRSLAMSDELDQFDGGFVPTR
ncbi:MAG: helix-turn-helix domain-containing protein [Propionibacteriaceae bacterium]|jgi:excisionase family DNA binding protein|nr:helix-turn-helix domain-containing protein [Propionibacteriaceae bacterium]